jgi:hypothetical protein
MATDALQEPAPQARQAGQPSIVCIWPKDWSGKHKTYNLLSEDNWQSWQDDITLTFGVCGLNKYVNGDLRRPNSSIDSDAETLTAIEVDDPFFDNINDYNVQYESFAANESARMYDWLADTGSTNHISNWRKLFSSYEPTLEATVHGVGGKITQVAGRGTINLIATYGTRKHTLCLENVNHIPSNKYNIFALGRWDSQGRRYQASNGELNLFDCRDVPVLKGHKIRTNIYKFQLTPYDTLNITNDKSYTFSCKEAKQTWETWHRRFGHVSYKGLKKLYEERLLDSFTVETNTPTPDCISCTEAKQSVKPFPARTEPV